MSLARPCVTFDVIISPKYLQRNSHWTLWIFGFFYLLRPPFVWLFRWSHHFWFRIRFPPLFSADRIHLEINQSMVRHGLIRYTLSSWTNLKLPVNQKPPHRVFLVLNALACLFDLERSHLCHFVIGGQIIPSFWKTRCKIRCFSQPPATTLRTFHFPQSQRGDVHGERVP